MLSGQKNTRRILTYGHDAVLLETRGLLLRANGFDADTVVTEPEFYLHIARAEPPYRLWILCHSIPKEERPALLALSTKLTTLLYQLETPVAPPDFLEKVAEALK
jgi:hypothetical protein